ncbi:fasciclin domain-containing protein [Photobacterium sanctipauli]|uniref:Fasciclin domain-containing protein n=1 Tax=Photobacterium sanctipauli TaxID=1342794 RepID=A0A2T3ND98_9GAMM|nr:fasciclin domain-containing protein [Photobacterium sanctipauli]PSW12150.1 fasciclin domain-containing protein [Photobacterium sanctipauli]
MNSIIRCFTIAIATLLLSATSFAAHHEDKAAQAEKNLVQVAANNSDFQTLVMAIKAADLVETLEGKGPFTVLAPLDEAFEKLPEGALAQLLDPENKDKLQAVLTYHVLPGALSAEEVAKLKLPETIQGGTLTVENTDGDLTINGAKVLIPDVEASNGIIHIIDTVLIPAE